MGVLSVLAWKTEAVVSRTCALHIHCHAVSQRLWRVSPVSYAARVRRTGLGAWSVSVGSDNNAWQSVARWDFSFNASIAFAFSGVTHAVGDCHLDWDANSVGWDLTGWASVGVCPNAFTVWVGGKSWLALNADTFVIDFLAVWRQIKAGVVDELVPCDAGWASSGWKGVALFDWRDADWKSSCCGVKDGVTFFAAQTEFLSSTRDGIAAIRWLYNRCAWGNRCVWGNWGVSDNWGVWDNCSRLRAGPSCWDNWSSKYG